MSAWSLERGNSTSCYFLDLPSVLISHPIHPGLGRGRPSHGLPLPVGSPHHSYNLHELQAACAPVSIASALAETARGSYCYMSPMALEEPVMPSEPSQSFFLSNSSPASPVPFKRLSKESNMSQGSHGKQSYAPSIRSTPANCYTFGFELVCTSSSICLLTCNATQISRRAFRHPSSTPALPIPSIHGPISRRLERHSKHRDHRD